MTKINRQFWGHASGKNSSYETLCVAWIWSLVIVANVVDLTEAVLHFAAVAGALFATFAGKRRPDARAIAALVVFCAEIAVVAQLPVHVRPCVVLRTDVAPLPRKQRGQFYFVLLAPDPFP